ncbi:1616_t:CDS:1, partial [Ambispora gerdemannii]
SHKKTSYELVYGNKFYDNCSLINDLFEQHIFNEEDIPSTINIKQDDESKNLDNDLIIDISP